MMADKNNISFRIKLYRTWQTTETGNAVLYEKGFFPAGHKSAVPYQQLEELIRKALDKGSLSSNEIDILATPATNILVCDDEVFFKADIIRTQPLFYGKTDGGFFVTDSLESYQDEFGLFEIEVSHLDEYLTACYVFGNKTLYKNVFVLQPGEVVGLNAQAVKSFRYFSFIPVGEQKEYNDDHLFVKDFDLVMSKVIERMLASAKQGTRWVLPLSGGHDSRMLANYLYKAGVKEVLCFSYGTPGNAQSEISRRVAEALGYKWHFVEYSEEKWGQLHSSNIFKTYINYAGKASSSPHLQDLLAMHELKTTGILKEGDIIVPGHALDFIAGSHLTNADITATDEKEYLKNVFQKFAPREKGKRNGFAYASFEAVWKKAACKPSHFQEYFNWQERQTKNIVNSIRIYEFFGFDVRLPYWDKIIVDFWLGIKPGHREKRNLLLRSERKGLLCDEIKNIEFEDEMNPVKEKKSHSLIRQVVPRPIIRFLLRLLKRKQVFAEGLNLVYAMEGKTIKDILSPVEDFPEGSVKYFKEFLGSYPFQLDYDFLTNLYCVRMLLNEQKKNNGKL
ncbi:MAG: asparagine synthase C-terminal domain-containing protein [Bacteroidota bacterium]